MSRYDIIRERFPTADGLAYNKVARGLTDANPRRVIVWNEHKGEVPVVFEFFDGLPSCAVVDLTERVLSPGGEIWVPRLGEIVSICPVLDQRIVTPPISSMVSIGNCPGQQG